MWSIMDFGNLDSPGDLVGTAPAFERVLERLPAIAGAREAVLIAGESGTGKELVARSIHRLGPRADGPFVAVNCGSLTDTLIEGELFGHERGAYTDAHARHEGLIAHAHGGAMFLDEVEALTPRAQVVLLRVLQDKTFYPLGSTTERCVDVRFVAATNDHLGPMVESGRFRGDLYYRLCVFTIELPPLRERREDILALAEHFLRKHQSPVSLTARLSAAAIAAFLSFDWPGNVRELESAIVRGIHLAKNGVIQIGDCGLPEIARCPPRAFPQVHATYRELKRQTLEAFDRQYVTHLMTEHRGNVSRAAHAAGKERRDLGKLLKRLGLVAHDFT